MDIEAILATLNRLKIRATYGAVGEALGIPAIAVGARLGVKRKEASWVVSKKTGMPSGYAPTQTHSELYSKKTIISSGQELRSLLEQERRLPSDPTAARIHTSFPPHPVQYRPPDGSDANHNTGSVTSKQGPAGVTLAGIDLAWISEQNGSGIAIGTIEANILTVNSIDTHVVGLDNVIRIARSAQHLSGVAIDAPLIIKNSKGSRPCESALSSKYSPKWAGCHPSNLTRYPNPSSVRLAKFLSAQGFRHMGKPTDGPWQIECYPHPALIEIFGLERRLDYKKKAVESRRQGQIRLADLLLGLTANKHLSLQVHGTLLKFFDQKHIASLRGTSLKSNEDALDAVICLYLAGLYALNSPMQYFGDTKSGYIVVPDKMPNQSHA